MRHITIIFFIFFYFQQIQSKELQVTVRNTEGDLLDLAMVSISPQPPLPLDQTDNGYPQPQIIHKVDRVVTRFTNKNGSVFFPIDDDKRTRYMIKIRKYPYRDLYLEFTITSRKTLVNVKLDEEKDAFKLSEMKKANLWLGAIKMENAEEKKVFQMQCGFCHQFGTEFIRQDRSIEEWRTVISRMIGYGSRLPTDLQRKMPEILIAEFNKLKKTPSLLEEPLPWHNYLINAEIVEWPTGDSMSQVHDAIVGQDGLIYAADNIQDRVYVVNTITNEIIVHKIPHRKEDNAGGLIAARLKEFPKHDSTSNAHSLAQSKKDGHIFITPSAQQRLIEFIPNTGEFKIHDFEQGFYPHTIRIDASDNVWFTLALSNQVAKFDRQQQKFTFFDLPARSFREKIITKYIKYLFVLMDWGIPLSKWLEIDRTYTGTPLAYGIDISPDQNVWFTRLHTNEIGFINPKDSTITMIKTPLMGPRRLRSDNRGHCIFFQFALMMVCQIV